MKLVTIIQARRGSTRLPNKVMLDLCGKELIVRMVERVLSAKKSGKVVVATTLNKEDDQIEEICKREGFECFRGHETDLLDRHYQAALKYRGDVVVKIPSDVPLIDSKVIDKVISFYENNQNEYDFVSNLHPQSYPDGNDVEIMSMKMLELAHQQAKQEYEREHTTPFFWDQPGRFRIGNVKWEKDLDYSMSHRFTIDYREDYEFIRRVYEELYPKNPDFSLGDILELLKSKPEIYEINQKYAGVNWYRNHVDELNTVDSTQTRKI